MTVVTGYALGKTKKKRSGLPFVQLFHWVLNSAAFRDLSSGAKVAYIGLKAKYNGKNNGLLAFGARGAGEELGMSRSTGNRALQELEAHGFILRQSDATFNSKRMSIEWALTELRNDVTGTPPTKDFMRWMPAGGGLGQHRKKPSLKGGRGDNEAQPPPAARSATDTVAGHRKKLVSECDITVSTVGSELAVSNLVPTDSLKLETVTRQETGPQSHQRDAYTSGPLGVDAYRPNRLRLLAAVRSRIAQRIDDQDVLDRITPVATAVTDHLIKYHFGDPLARAVLETFPGSRLTVSSADLDKSIEHIRSGQGR